MFEEDGMVEISCSQVVMAGVADELAHIRPNCAAYPSTFGTYRCVSWYGGIPPYFCTAPGPALYAARARLSLPLNCFNRLPRKCAPPSRLWAGSKASVTPRPRAVASI